MNVVSREEINEKLKSLGIVLNEGVSMVKLYPVLKQATSCSPEPTPGYIYHILIDFSYRGKKNAELLGDYLTRRLSSRRSGSYHGLHNTLKTIDHVVKKGSKNFRHFLRQHDEEIRRTSSNFNLKSDSSAHSLQDEVREIADKILKQLFNEDLMLKDNSVEVEVVPEMKLSGLGSLGSSSQGFGNVGSGRSTGGLTAQFVDVLEQIVYAPDPKQELLESCLKGSVGQYKPATVDTDNSPDYDTLLNKKRAVGRSWCSDSDGEISEDDLSEFCGLYANTGMGGDVSLVSADGSLSSASADNHQLITGSTEFSTIITYCKNEDGSTGLEDFEKLQNVMKTLENGHRGNILQSIQYLTSTESDDTLLRALGVVENLAARSLLPPGPTFQALKTNLEMKRLDSNLAVATKSSKILTSLEFLKDYKISQ